MIQSLLYMIYFLPQQVIQELVSQRSRNEFLTMAYEVEDRGHRETHRLLTALNMLLKKQVQGQQHRMVCILTQWNAEYINITGWWVY